MSALFVISSVIWTVGFTFSVIEWFPVNRLLCDCRTGWMAYRHLKSVWLFVIGASYVVSDAVAVAGGKKVPIIALVGVYYLWRWWVHSKNSRKRMKDRVIGVVREAAAGLKVVPVPDGAS